MAFLSLDTPAQRMIFFTYMGLWISYGLLNQRAKENHVMFNSTSAVLMQALLKLVLATGMFCVVDQGSIASFLTAVRVRPKDEQSLTSSPSLFVLYLIPAGLYALYDILSYINLQRMDATTYFLLLQFRLVLTAVLHQYMFSKKLLSHQWMALGITTLGCLVKTLGDTQAFSSSPEDTSTSLSLTSYLLLLLQIVASTTAGVYNERLLKGQAQVSINVQNMIMYLDSIVVLLVVLMTGVTGKTLSSAVADLPTLLSLEVLPMILIMSCVGVVTSLFLKWLDSVRKALASALELVCLPLFSMLLFHTQVTGHLVLAVALVSSGTYLYSQPVVRRTTSSTVASNNSSPSNNNPHSSPEKEDLLVDNV